MYRIIGVDGLQYGPVSADEIRRWIASGRADRETMAQAEGSPDWKALSTFPEFADALASKAAAAPPPPPAAPPVLAAAQSSASAGESRAGGTVPPTLATISSGEIDVGSCLGRAWDLLVSDPWPIMGITALVWLTLSATHAVYVGFVVTGPLLGGLYYYYLRKIRGQHAELPDAFSGFTLCFVQLMLASVVMLSLTAIGFLLCVVPGIYLSVVWMFALPAAMDKRMNFWDAMELSRKRVNERWWSAAWLLLLCALINIGGVLLCGIGIFFTIPLTLLAKIYAYEDVFNSAKTS